MPGGKMTNLAFLLAAMIQVESSGNNLASNANENAYGPLQIRPIVIEDVSRILSNPYQHALCTNLAYSIHIAKAYINHYATSNRLGRIPSYQDAARIWNGGPNGFRKASTLDYWRKVQGKLK